MTKERELTMALKKVAELTNQLEQLCYGDNRLADENERGHVGGDYSSPNHHRQLPQDVNNDVILNDRKASLSGLVGGATLHHQSDASKLGQSSAIKVTRSRSSAGDTKRSEFFLHSSVGQVNRTESAYDSTAAARSRPIAVEHIRSDEPSMAQSWTAGDSEHPGERFTTSTLEDIRNDNK